MQSFSSIISKLGGPTAVAALIGAKPDAVQKMKLRDSVPAKYWPPVIAEARKRRIRGVSHETLVALAARSRRAA